MAEGIVVKIWNVSANSSTRSGASQIQSSIAYIENPEKVGVRIGDNAGMQVGNELSYVMNDMKTLDGLYVGCRHISDIKNATEEMMQIKEYCDTSAISKEELVKVIDEIYGGKNNG